MHVKRADIFHESELRALGNPFHMLKQGNVLLYSGQLHNFKRQPEIHQIEELASEIDSPAKICRFTIAFGLCV